MQSALNFVYVYAHVLFIFPKTDHFHETATESVLDDTGSDACAKVQDRLLKAWSVIEPNAEACGSALFR